MQAALQTTFTGSPDCDGGDYRGSHAISRRVSTGSNFGSCLQRESMTYPEIHDFPLFASISEKSASELLELIRVRSVPAGSPLFRQGDGGDSMFFVLSGRVRIHLQDSTGNDTPLAELGRGDFFGEMAILNGRPRSANATAETDVRLGALTASDFLGFVLRSRCSLRPPIAAAPKILSKKNQELRYKPPACSPIPE